MDAIVEAIGAMLHLCVLVAELFVRSIFFFLEMCRFGFEEAIRRNQRRRNDGVSPVLTRLGGLGLFAVTIFTVGGLLYWWHSHHQRKVAATEQLLDRLAEGYYQETTQGDPVFENGPLPEHDAWGRPIRLDTEKSLMGWWIVVSSDGPDGRPATSDDVKSTRSNWANLEQVGGELAARGTNKVKEKFRGMFAGGDEDSPEEADVEPAHEIAAAEGDTADKEVAANDPAEGEPDAEDKKRWKLPSLNFGWGKKEEDTNVTTPDPTRDPPEAS